VAEAVKKVAKAAVAAVAAAVAAAVVAAVAVAAVITSCPSLHRSQSLESSAARSAGFVSDDEMLANGSSNKFCSEKLHSPNCFCVRRSSTRTANGLSPVLIDS
jgi:hypothetical protein